jgi:Protein of unknown function (DUF2500)
MAPAVAPRCPHCAAPVAELRAERCSFCGNALLPATPEPPHTEARAPTTAELLARVERHPELATWLAWSPPDLSVRFQFGAKLALGVFVLFAGVVVLIAAAAKEPFAAVIALVVLAIGAAITLTAGLRAASFSRAPLQRVPAFVADERTKVSDGGSDSSASTTYYATLEQADGQREEFEIDSKLAGAIAPGDFGLAYVRAGLLLDFRRAGSR